MIALLLAALASLALAADCVPTPEICDGLDQDCDGVVDEPEDLGPDSGCTDVYADRDGDGYGASDETACLCFVADTTGLCPDGDERYDDRCWSPLSTDCYDYDGAISPAAQGEDVDGDDDDCDGYVPLLELDCDDDGGFALLPGGPRDHVDDAASAGLADCDGGGAPSDRTVTCWDGVDVGLTCDPVSHLWLVALGQDGVADRFDGPRRIGVGSCEPTDDCDDTCPARCSGATEACDGLDDDCDHAGDLVVADTDGIPDSMDDGAPRLGYVSPTEADRDGDGFFTCTDAPTGAQTVVTGASCGTGEAAGYGDCDDECALATPAAEEERCDGFQDRCGGDPEGDDADGDGFSTCGAWTDPGSQEDVEDVFTLVWLHGDDPAVPLLPARAAAPACDQPLADAVASLAGEQITDADADAVRSLLSLCVAADECAAGWPASDHDCAALAGGACSVVRVGLVRDDVSDDADHRDAAMDARPGCADEPYATSARTVWTASRVALARRLVVEWDCYRSDGTWGCGDLEPPSGWTSRFSPPSPSGGYVANPQPGDVFSDAKWWLELGRYAVTPLGRGTIDGCWGDPREGVGRVSTVVGGDCDDADASSNRGTAEGPDDLAGQYAGDPASCATCENGIDDNCDGNVDCEDPACARCFVGAGSGCGSASPCARYSCDALGGLATPSPYATFLALLGGAFGWRRRKAPR